MNANRRPIHHVKQVDGSIIFHTVFIMVTGQPPLGCWWQHHLPHPLSLSWWSASPMVASCWRMRSSGQMAASGHKLAFLPPACLSDNLHAAIFRHNFSQEIFTFFENGKIHTHTCQLDARTCFYTISSAGCLLPSCWTSTPICWSPPPVPAFVRASANVNRSFYRGSFLFKLELFIHPTKGSPPASDSHHSMRYFRTPMNADL